MARTREIKKRMKAVSNIQRITKTMQMIATARFSAAVQRVEQTKPFTEKIRQLVREVAASAGDVEHPLINGPERPAKRELLLVISSDRGLCGAYNANVLRTALKHLRSLQNDGCTFTLETAGKKASGFFRFQGLPVDQRHAIGDKPTYEDVERIAARYIEHFSAGEYDAVRVVSMRFISTSRQVPEILQLMPMKAEAIADDDDQAARGAATANYDFSPSSAELLADLLPLAVKTDLFQAFNDAVVSEQIMRMVAMKAATENARDLSRTLRRKFNRARQTQITTELMEVIAGAASLE